MCERTPGTEIELRTTRTGRYPKLSPLCPTTRPPTSHHSTFCFQRGRSWTWLQHLQSQYGNHSAVLYMRTKPMSRGTLSAQPCPATGTRTTQCPGARVMLCWKDPRKSSQQAPPQHLGAREVSPRDSEARREIESHSSVALQLVSWLLLIYITTPKLLPGATGPPHGHRRTVISPGSRSCRQPRQRLPARGGL